MPATEEVTAENGLSADQQLTSCSLCGQLASSRSPYPCGDKSNPLSLSGVDRCDPCGIAWAVPRLGQTELDRFYNDGAYWDGAADNPFLLAHQRVQARVRLRTVAPLVRHLPAVRVLDVGAGNALIADELPTFLAAGQASYTLLEPDPGRRASNLAKALPFPVCAIDSLGANTGPYEVIFLNHVLEHVADPVALLRELGALLDERGILYVEVPNLDNQYKDDVFPHVQFFSSRSLRAVAERAGLECVDATSFGRPAERGGQRQLLWSLRSTVGVRAFNVAVRLRQPWLMELTNRWMYAYSPQHDGLWVRGVFRRA
jgi:2-polyprenyl-3-methyl-5-hydroxy-6-metoxy-1,4-benzoquinol methylase